MTSNRKLQIEIIKMILPVDILILWRCRSDIALDIALTLQIYCKWNTWRCQFVISVWHQDLDIGPTRLLVLSWHRHNNGRYPAERNLPGLCTTPVSDTIIPRLYCGNWKLKLQMRFFWVAATKNFPTTLLYLKFVFNIVSRNTYWERRTKMWSN